GGQQHPLDAVPVHAGRDPSRQERQGRRQARSRREGELGQGDQEDRDRELQRAARGPDDRDGGEAPSLNLRPVHALRSAIIGSTAVARLAGKNDARRATTTRTTDIARNVGGSVALTSKRRLVISRASRCAPTRPSARPAATRTIDSRRTRCRTEPGFAPRAMRMPNSCVRSPTENAMTPAMPADVTARARAANSARSVAVRRGEASELVRTWSSVWKR